MTARNGRVAELIKEAEAAGAVVTLSKGGHWKVFNPATRQSVCIPATPGPSRSVFNARTRLRRIGLAISSVSSKRRTARKSRPESDLAR